jgi:hypothetical protein
LGLPQVKEGYLYLQGKAESLIPDGLKPQDSGTPAVEKQYTNLARDGKPAKKKDKKKKDKGKKKKKKKNLRVRVVTEAFKALMFTKSQHKKKDAHCHEGTCEVAKGLNSQSADKLMDLMGALGLPITE